MVRRCIIKNFQTGNKVIYDYFIHQNIMKATLLLTKHFG